MKTKNYNRKFSITPYIYIAPFFIGYGIFALYPTFYALFLSLFNWGGVGPKIFVGLQNYINAFQNEFFWNSLLISFKYILIGPVTTFLALILSFILSNKMVKGTNLYRITYFLPQITMPVAIGLLFRILLGWDYGILNKVLIAMNLINTPINWLGDPNNIFWCVLIVVVWRYFGIHIIIYLGGIRSIDPALYEAARIDGANQWKVFSRITLPLLKPYIVYLLITGINGSINLFDEPMMLFGVGGGPYGAGQNAGLFIYQAIFVNNQWGYGSALSFIVFVIVAALSLLFFRINYRKGMEG